MSGTKIPKTLDKARASDLLRFLRLSPQKVRLSDSQILQGLRQMLADEQLRLSLSRVDRLIAQSKGMTDTGAQWMAIQQQLTKEWKLQDQLQAIAFPNL